MAREPSSKTPAPGERPDTASGQVPPREGADAARQTSNTEPARQHPHIRNLVTHDPALIVSLQGVGYLTAGLTRYKEALAHLAQQKFGPKLDTQRRGQLKRLQQIDSFIASGLIWKESPLIADLLLNLANLSRSFGDRLLTRNALGTALLVSDGHKRHPLLVNSPANPTVAEARMIERLRADWKRLEHKYAQRAKRYVEAGIDFGLLERDDDCSELERDNCKPLRATHVLHDLMIKIGVGLGDDIDADSKGARAPAKPAPNGNDDTESGT